MNFGSTEGKGRSGAGAWEVAARFSWLDLTDNGVKGGQIQDYTGGVHWYWDPYTKMVFNYVHATAQASGAAQTQTDMFGIRAQLDFWTVLVVTARRCMGCINDRRFGRKVFVFSRPSGQSWIHRRLLREPQETRVPH